ncbi:MAG TPA: fructose-bisphosphatase class II, partial [Vicinamibacterales bacterium]|nr:fructose-bisphosphatase class II [Vicinamibacterales bacterium]
MTTTTKTHTPTVEELNSSYIDSDLSLDFLRVVEQAAIACAHTMGQGDRHNSDQVAVEAMRKEMDSLPIDG